MSRNARKPVVAGRTECWDDGVAITVRPITLDDVERTVEVLCAASGLAELAEDFRHDALEQARGEIPNSITNAICWDDHQVGRLRVVRVPQFIEIAGLQVHPDWQNRGIGTTVVTSILSEGSGTGLPVELDVARDNPDARRLYERLGFTQIREDERDYRMRREPRPVRTE